MWYLNIWERAVPPSTLCFLSILQHFSNLLYDKIYLLVILIPGTFPPSFPSLVTVEGEGSWPSQHDFKSIGVAKLSKSKWFTYNNSVCLGKVTSAANGDSFVFDFPCHEYFFLSYFYGLNSQYNVEQKYEWAFLPFFEIRGNYLTFPYLVKYSLHIDKFLPFSNFANRFDHK